MRRGSRHFQSSERQGEAGNAEKLRLSFFEFDFLYFCTPFLVEDWLMEQPR
jgi:hypothetical protein